MVSDNVVIKSLGIEPHISIIKILGHIEFNLIARFSVETGITYAFTFARETADMKTQGIGQRLPVFKIHAFVLVIQTVAHANAAAFFLTGFADQVDDASG